MIEDKHRKTKMHEIRTHYPHIQISGTLTLTLISIKVICKKNNTENKYIHITYYQDTVLLEGRCPDIQHVTTDNN